MKLAIFGASGGTGQHLVQQALAQNHVVTAFARRPESIVGAPSPGLTVFQGDIHDEKAVSQAVAGCDAVLSALGARTLGRSDILEVGVLNILAGMAAQGISRIIVLGAAGASGNSAAHQGAATRLFLALISSTVLRQPFRSQREQERLLAESTVQYTVACPPRLLDRPAIGHYRVQEDGLPPGGVTIPRADVADFMLRQLSDSQWIRKRPYLAT
jgi:putative NADH-flavin reductase